MQINFDELFVDGATTLEIYRRPPAHQTGTEADVDVGWTRPFDLKGGSVNTVTLDELYYKDLTCAYDKATDSQKVYRRILCKDFIVNDLYVAVFREELVPAYMFPCSLDIPFKTQLTRKTIRINNRMYLTVDSEDEYHYCYVRYTHADHVDSVKMKMDLNDALSRLMRVSPSPQ